MKKLFSFLFFCLLISNILCDNPSTEPTTEPTTDPTTDPTTTPEANTYGGTCTVADPDPCTTANTQCTNSKCVCKSGYVENKNKNGCDETAGYGNDCTSKPCDTTETCDSNKKCVCATGYKEKSDKSGCEKDTSTTTETSNSSFIKSSLMILLGITVF